MTFSNNSPNLSTAAPGEFFRTHFKRVIVFGYDDGPASGLAIYASGKGVRFFTVGDSQTRMERAFVISHIRGEWSEAVEELSRFAIMSDARILVPRGDSVALRQLERRVDSAEALDEYVGFGPPDMERLMVAPLAPKSKAELIRLRDTLSGFELAERLARRTR